MIREGGVSPRREGLADYIFNGTVLVAKGSGAWLKGIVLYPPLFCLLGFGRGQKRPWVDVAGEGGESLAAGMQPVGKH